MTMEWQTELLNYFIRERELVRLNKAHNAPPPWTTDPILANYRFTNVHREHDKVTIWIRDNWRDKNFDHPNLTGAMVLARMLNNPDTLESVGFPYVWDEEKILAGINARRNGYGKWLNAAYLITTCGVRMDKVEYIVDVATRANDRVYAGRTLQEYHAELMRIKGLGQFLSAQVVADLKNTPRHPLTKAPDFMTWAAPGPGSLRGLAAVLGVPRVSEGQFLALATKLKTQVPAAADLHMQDFQNCLCEFSKYDKAHKGTGVPKQRYFARG